MYPRVAAIVLLLVQIASAGEAATTPSSAYAERLAVESDALLRLAVKRPFGTGWDPAALVAKPDGHPKSVDTGKLATPAAGWILLHAGRLLGRDDLVTAAYGVAHGFAAGQTPTGQIPSPLVFGSKAGSRMLEQPVPDRASTVASLALLLAVLDDSKAHPDVDPAKADLYRGAATRAAHWLLKQQAATGTWPTGFPADAPALKQIKLVKLDDPDFRDCTLALLLAGRALDDRNLVQGAQKSLADLTNMTQTEPKRWAGLWCRGYNVDGTFYFKGNDFPKTPDILACRYAMQTLLVAAVLTGRQEYLAGTVAAAAGVNAVRNPDGSWDEFVPAYVGSADRAFDPAASQPSMRRIGDVPDFDLPPLLDAVATLERLGKDEFATRAGQTFSPPEQVQRALVGLTDDPLRADIPATLDALKADINARPAKWSALEGGLPDKLDAKLHRLDLLLSAAAVK